MPRNNDPGTIGTGPGLPSAKKDPSELGAISPGLSKHVNASSGAHQASAIDVDSNPPIYNSSNVEGVLDELAALVPPRPPTLGNYSALSVLGTLGIPDWGVLKLNDSALDQRDGANSAAIDLAEAYGYYFSPPEPTDQTLPFSVPGEDPRTDPTFNVADGTYTGGGEGATHSGAFTRDVGGPNPLTTTMRVVESSGPSGGKAVVVSGVLYPADRGVLALLHWPADGDVAAFLAQSLLDRCPAALLCGQGVSSGCDGQAGGIFSLGDSSGSYDPFAFPGQASGQYSLEELHTAISDIDATALGFVADPGAGQVRLGTDANAGITPIVGGIPILGASTAATGGGNDNNFFRYRLPYLDDYASLQYTPADEAPRFFIKPAVSLNPGVDLTSAGDYTDFNKDYWHFQLARYRHRFFLDDTVILAGEPRDNGSWILLHFKTEAKFEALVRDGVVPSNADLYSANLIDWTNPEAPENIATNDPPTYATPQANSYHILRSAIYEDPDGQTPVVVNTAEYNLSGAKDLKQTISGVQYFSPVDTVLSPQMSISVLDFATNAGFFEHSYYTFDEADGTDLYLSNFAPLIFNIAPFSFGEDSGTPTYSGGTASSITARRRQHIAISYRLMGAFSDNDGPLPADVISYSQGSNILPSGDTDYPSFTSDARIRAFLRRPLGHDSAALTLQQVDIPHTSGDLVLFHSSRLDSTPVFGNFTALTQPHAAGLPLAELESLYKDTNERFLDEVYRISSKWPTIPSPQKDLLLGPGLQGFPPQTILDLPVRVGTTGSAYSAVSWMQQGFFLSDLSSVVDVNNELQVAGLPHRSPTMTDPSDAVKDPYPSAGLLMYPQKDYSTGYLPSFPAIVTSPQPDYSGIVGDRQFVRAFDVDFSRSPNPVGAAGTDTVFLRIRGLQLADFAYAAPGPGNTDIAILIKIPGLTTWMDLGRADGAGPSKQDALLDGAGCQVVGPNTFDSIDPETRVVFCQVEATSNPVNFYDNNSNECVLLVKVIIKDSVGGRALNFEQTAATDDNANQRGLVGIEIVRQS